MNQKMTNFGLKLKIFTTGNRFLIENFKSITVLAKRTRFSDAYFRINDFEDKRKSLLAHQFYDEKKVISLKETIKSTLKAGEKLKRDQVENLFYLSNSKQDLELAFEAFKS